MYTFTEHDIEAISHALAVPARRNESGGCLEWHVVPDRNREQRELLLNVWPASPVAGEGKSAGVVVSIHTPTGYFELHDVDALTLFGEEEVIFTLTCGEKLSGLVIGRRGNVSLFANVDRSLLSSDYSRLAPELLLSAMQLGAVVEEPR